jgi:hypothetical protein
MHLSLRSARRATATAMTVAVAATGLLASACTPATVPTNKVISGTVQGADGNYVDVYLGFDVLDSAGRKIDLGGGPGYSAVQRINHCLPASGAAAPAATCTGTGYRITKNWSLTLPPNAATVYIEVYPKSATSTDWLNNYNGFTGVAAGSTVLSTYGETYRRAIATPGNMQNIPIVLPVICGLPGASTGTLTGHISGWPSGVVGHLNTWSQAPNTLATQGMALGTPIDGNGNYRIDKLQAGQAYGLIASGTGFYRNVVNFTNASPSNPSKSPTYIGSACQVKTYNF